jgi:hypothetical protein
MTHLGLTEQTHTIHKTPNFRFTSATRPFSFTAAVVIKARKKELKHFMAKATAQPLVDAIPGNNCLEIKNVREYGKELIKEARGAP